MKAQWALRVIKGKQNVSQLARQRSIITFNFKGTETEKIVRLSYVTPLSAGLKNNFLSKVYSSKFNIWHGKKTKITPARMDRLRSVSISSQFKARAARRKINILFMKVSLRARGREKKNKKTSHLAHSADSACAPWHLALAMCKLMMLPINKLATMAPSVTARWHTRTKACVCRALSVRGARSLSVLVPSDRWLVNELNGRIFYCRLKEEENERWGIERREEKKKTREIAPLHQRGKSFHVLEITQWHLHSHIRSHGCMYEHDLSRTSPHYRFFFSLSLCFTYSIVVTHTYSHIHTLTRASKDHRDPGMRKAERPDQCWALVINFNWRKGAAEHRNIMTFLPCLHTLLANKTHSHNIIPARGVHIKSTFS